MMRLFFVFLVFAFLAPALAQASVEALRRNIFFSNGLNVYANAGLRSDDVDWNIASDITGSLTPNILSELTWSGLRSHQLEIGADYTSKKGLYLEGSINTGWIHDGSNQDSDYLGNNRTSEFSRSNNSADSGDISDMSIAAGLPRYLNTGAHVVRVMPMIGYDVNRIDLKMTNGVQTIPASGAFAGLNSTYNAEWKGPWLGMDLNTSVGTRHNWGFRYEYHWFDYYADANWNLRVDLKQPKSFEHITEGAGSVIKAKYNYTIAKNRDFHISYSMRNWESKPGLDRVFFADDTIVETRLNEVKWSSRSLMMGLKYGF